MMTHPDELFDLAKRRIEQNQREVCLANAQASQMRHWLAEQVRRWADRLDSSHQSTESVVGKY
jgi:hypothetical protein